ncbi:hypothetical protein ACG02S_00695 [Roseateles sp. DC23W]|uniref:Uncharacterized protein n=1 Tax=Pelomonas dachongensis TaxID=3299029 RepID=A0ABW7EG20_9BURK
MSTAARYSQVLLAFWRQRDLNAPLGRRLVMALLVLIGMTGLIALPPETGWLLVAGLLLLVGLGVWLAVCGSLQEQNHPTTARTMPGHVRTLRRAALLGWTLCTGLSTLLLWAIFPPSGTAPGLLLTCGFIAVFLLWSSRMVWLWLLFTLMSPLLGAFSGWLAPAAQALAELWSAHTAAMVVGGLLIQAALVVLAFDAGGARHRDRYARQTLMRSAMRLQLDGRPANAAAWGRPIEWMTRPFGAVVDAWQRRLLARADNGRAASVMARAHVVLHGAHHWMYQLMGIGTLASLVLIAFTAVSLVMHVPLKAFLPGAFGMGVAIASMGFNPVFALPTALWESRREQALLCLVPGMPRGVALSRAVAVGHLCNAAGAWLGTSLVLLALGLVASNRWLLCLPLAALPVMAVNLTRRTATMRAPQVLTTVWPVLAFLALTGALYGLSQLGVPMALLAVAVPALSVGLLAWRWRALERAPTALPVGRLS